MITSRGSEHAAEMRRCILELDVKQVQKLWRQIAPSMPQCEDDNEALATLHYSRTTADFAPFKLRAWSHCWLKDNGIPSGLPDDMKPHAERMYPRVVDAVGHSTNFRSPLLKPLKKEVEGAIDTRICELWADNQKDPERIRREIRDTKERTVRKLLGRIE